MEPTPPEDLAWTDEDATAAVVRVRAIALALPEVTERESHGAPAWFVRDKRQVCTVWEDHHGDGRLGLISAAPEGAQEEGIRTDPARFYRPAYVGHRGWIGLRLEVDVDWDEVAGVIEEAYRMVAPKILIRQLDIAAR